MEGKLIKLKIDNFYFVVEDIEKSINFYSQLLGKNPTNITEKRWADWENEDNHIYFGLISKDAADCEPIKGNNGVLGLYTSDLDKSFKLCKNIGAKILYEPEPVPNSEDNYRCFAIEDLDGNKIEIAYYDK